MEKLLITVFEDWTRHDIGFVVLRNYENLPASTGNDVDVLIAPRRLKEAERTLISAAAKCGFLIHNRVEFATLSCFFFHPETLTQIQIDLFSSLKWHAFEFLPACDVVSRRMDRNLFSIPSPADEAIISLLTRLIYRGHVRESYKEAILKNLRAMPDKVEQLLTETFGSSLARELVQASLGEDWQRVVDLKSSLRRSLVFRCVARHPLRTALSLLSDGARFLRRLSRPGGIIVAVMGADGSGKSTAGQRAIAALTSTFNPGKMREVHWKPIVFFKRKRKPSGKPNLDPHGQPPRNRLASLFYLCAHWLEFLIGSQVYFRQTVFRNGLVLIDRYHYDFLVDQRRYRLNVHRWLIRALFACVKKPDLIFLFDAPPEVLQARKQEVPFAETARQVAAYRELIGSLSQGHILNASQPIDKVTADFVSRVLRYMHDRMQRQ